MSSTLTFREYSPEMSSQIWDKIIPWKIKTILQCSALLRVVIYLSISRCSYLLKVRDTGKYMENKSRTAGACFHESLMLLHWHFLFRPLRNQLETVTFRTQHFNSSAGNNTLICLTFTDHLVSSALQILSCRRTKLRKEKTKYQHHKAGGTKQPFQPSVK